jgi:hypothetical protein
MTEPTEDPKPTVESLREQIKGLKARIAELEWEAR